MATPPFDASKAVTFDVARGVIARGGGASSVLVPVDALVELCTAAGPEAASAFARTLGERLGTELRARWKSTGTDVRVAGVDSVVEHLAGEWAVHGLGTLSIERWGQALVFVADHASLRGPTGALISTVLGSALTAATGTPCRCVALARDGSRIRLLVTGDAGVTRVRAWLGRGVSWGEVLVRLHGITGSDQ